MVLDSVLSKAPADDTELLQLLLKLERFDFCIEAIIYAGGRRAARFVPVATEILVLLGLQEAFPCGDNFFFLLWGYYVGFFDVSSYRNLNTFKTLNSLDNSWF